jgi:hypothetical protein
MSRSRAKVSVAFRRPFEKWQIVYGREAEALVKLVQSGERGLSGIECGATRLAAYVHDLRHHFGLEIETKHEAHGGPFAGSHARYFLVSAVELGNVDCGMDGRLLPSLNAVSLRSVRCIHPARPTRVFWRRNAA